jgi:hypothetical protein
MAFHVFLMKLSFILIFIVGLGGVNNSWLKVEGFVFFFERLKFFSNFNHMCSIKTANCFINVEIEQHVSLDVILQHVVSSKLVVVSSNATPID